MADLQEGRIGTAPDGTRVIVRNGQIVPYNQGGSPGAPAGMTRLADGSVMSGVGPRGGAPKRISGVSVQEQKMLSDARNEASLVDTTLSDLERFGRVSANERTGGLMGLPFAKEIIGAFDPGVAELNEITARLAPAQRAPGSGTTSDRDLALFLQATPGAQRPDQANEAIINRGRQEGARRQLYAEFLDRYARQNGTLNGAQEAWRQAYNPPPVADDSPAPRGNLRVTPAQRQAVNRMNEAGTRNTRSLLGTRENPRVPPEGFDITTLPQGDWYVTPAGQVQQVSRGRANSRLRNQSARTRAGVTSVRRID